MLHDLLYHYLEEIEAEIKKLEDAYVERYEEEILSSNRIRDIISHHYDLTKILYFSQSNELGV